MGETLISAFYNLPDVHWPTMIGWGTKQCKNVFKEFGFDSIDICMANLPG